MKYLTISTEGPQGGNIHNDGVNAYPLDPTDPNYSFYKPEFSSDSGLYPYIEPKKDRSLTAAEIVANLNNIYSNNNLYLTSLLWDLWPGYKKTGMQHGANGGSGLPLNYPTHVYPPSYPAASVNTKSWTIWAQKGLSTSNVVFRFAGTNSGSTEGWTFNTTQTALTDDIIDIESNDNVPVVSAIYNRAFIKLHEDMPYGMLVDGRTATTSGNYEKDAMRYNYYSPQRDFLGSNSVTYTIEITLLVNVKYTGTQYALCGCNTNTNMHLRIRPYTYISLMNASNNTTVWPKLDTRNESLYVDNPTVLNNLYLMNVNSKTSWYDSVMSANGQFTVDDCYKLLQISYHTLTSNNAKTYETLTNDGFKYCINGKTGILSETETITSFTRMSTRSTLDNSSGYYTCIGGRTGITNLGAYPPVAMVFLDMKLFNKRLTHEEMKYSQMTTFRQLNLGCLFKRYYEQDNELSMYDGDFG